VGFLAAVSYVAALAGVILLVGAGLYFQRRLTREKSYDQIVEPDGDRAPLRHARGA
jgi:hypothetical protein